MIHMTAAPYAPMYLHRNVSRNSCLEFSLNPSWPTLAKVPKDVHYILLDLRNPSKNSHGIGMDLQ